VAQRTKVLSYFLSQLSLSKSGQLMLILLLGAERSANMVRDSSIGYMMLVNTHSKMPSIKYVVKRDDGL